ncbi:uncharacterized protein K489DRAFT_382671 [Dissoconium aciculare CBS 342.82]|uniref:Uncharacterized protein n=1 Tax=Dissoconium aciculare CBS 342.82 TaxID=1314786 RepID=A0A6J3LY83_9PEZI|nr:uncharacterized protein K489DRAFT_382671 [Dissoconium aciculare CBS 342.82]KAF1820730.1 hypothetical protein K489DRAFT_382671 [Dissoconium aciculare CBS 342.82]
MTEKFHRRRCSWTTIIVNGIVLGGVVVMESSAEESSTDHDPKKLKCSLWEEGLASAATTARSQIRNVRMYDRKKKLTNPKLFLRFTRMTPSQNAR